MLPVSHHSNHMEMLDMITTVNPIPVLSLDILPVSCGHVMQPRRNVVSGAGGVRRELSAARRGIF